MKANAIIGQSGGPTPVINASLVGIVDAALPAAEITGVFGMRFGIEGFMQELLVDLGGQLLAVAGAPTIASVAPIADGLAAFLDEQFPSRP